MMRCFRRHIFFVSLCGYFLVILSDYVLTSHDECGNSRLKTNMEAKCGVQNIWEVEVGLL